MFQGKGKVLVLGAVILVLGGCTGKNHMVAIATATNLALEQSTNEMLLLNIIRASLQKPMYFTALGNVTVTDTVKVSGEFSLPFGGDATNLFKFTPSFSAEARPQFTVTVIDDKDFTKALHTPVSLDTLKLFKSLGWPTEFLLYLFVDRLEKESGIIGNITYSVEETKGYYPIEKEYDEKISGYEMDLEKFRKFADVTTFHISKKNTKPSSVPFSVRLPSNRRNFYLKFWPLRRKGFLSRMPAR